MIRRLRSRQCFLDINTRHRRSLFLIVTLLPQGASCLIILWQWDVAFELYPNLLVLGIFRMKNMFSQQIISRYKSLISTVYYRSPVVLLKFSKADNDTSFSSSRRFEIFPLMQFFYRNIVQRSWIIIIII